MTVKDYRHRFVLNPVLLYGKTQPIQIIHLRHDHSGINANGEPNSWTDYTHRVEVPYGDSSLLYNGTGALHFEHLRAAAGEIEAAIVLGRHVATTSIHSYGSQTADTLLQTVCLEGPHIKQSLVISTYGSAVSINLSASMPPDVLRRLANELEAFVDSSYPLLHTPDEVYDE